MTRLKGQILICALAAAASIALLWTASAVGFIASAIMLVLLMPWGRTVGERMVITGVLLLGIVAIVFPRDSAMPITATSSRIFISALLVIVLALAIIRTQRTNTSMLPRFTGLDAIVLALIAIATAWPISAYLGASPQQILSALYFGGWDNASHFIAFANTYVQEGTRWTTTDGTLAWNQWYPSLHTTVFSLAQQAAGIGGLTREGLLFPYAVWTTVGFAGSMAALTWIAGDLARRWIAPLAGKRSVLVASVAAGFATAAWALLGSPQSLLNAGFLNFLMGTALVASASYLSARSWTSARTLGWLLIPLALIAVIGLWTPLALVLVPAGVVTLIALWRWSKPAAIAWTAANIVVAAFLAWTQLSAVIAIEDATNVSEFGEHIGRVGTGMTPFNVSAALAAPIIGIAVAIILRKRSPLSVAVSAPGVAAIVLAGLFAVGTISAYNSLIRSYYVLKALDAGLLAIAPIIAAAIAVGFALLLRQLSTVTALATATIALVLGTTIYGYVGSAPQGMSPGFTPAPGIQAGWVRAGGVQDDLIGESILTGVRGGQLRPDAWPVLWDGSGLLPNLWVAALSETPTADQMAFYGELGEFPYGDEAADALSAEIASDPERRIAVVWYRGVSGDFLTGRLGFVDPTRLTLIQETVTSSALCEDC